MSSNDLVAKLPASVQRLLPRGWKRRPFDNALVVDKGTVDVETVDGLRFSIVSMPVDEYMGWKDWGLVALNRDNISKAALGLNSTKLLDRGIVSLGTAI